MVYIKLNSRNFIAIFISLILILTCTINVQLNKDESFGREDLPLTIKTTLPFNITGNNELSSYSVSGVGTTGNPYIIGNYVIDATGLGVHGIFINSTTAYFTLRNCTIVGSDASYAGIALLNVLHGTIFNNTVQNCDYGILLEQSNNCRLEKNQVNYNNFDGIYLRDYQSDTKGCYYNTIVHNTATHNGYAGIYVTFSPFNLISSNIVSNQDYGTLLRYSYLVTIFNNSVGPDNDYGIAFLMSSSDIVKGNTIFNNNGSGIYMETAGSHNVSDNLIHSNSNGIDISNFAMNNIFYHNLIWQNGVDVVNGTGPDTWIENLYNASGDFDGDSLINLNETIWKTSCFLIDSDADGLNDTFEIAYGTTPSNNDTDTDGLLDGAELFTYLTNATNPDTDGDGFMDGIEVAAGTDPLDPLSFPAEPPGIPGFGLYLCVISLIVTYKLFRRYREAKLPQEL